ncbi:Tetratricopeptide TPR_4 [mine drainage metagenome]|uniref:Tetratricopeptide TPR_4 n=1 Tax=mine drainage metagenome TaxID=410659 RepID=T1CY16_9ZZZZ
MPFAQPLRERRWVRILPGLLALWVPCALGAPIPPPAPRPVRVPGLLHQIRVLAQAGAPELALARLEKLAPRNPENPAWTSWIRERIRLLERTHQWSLIVAQLAKLPPNLPPEFITWARSRDVRALIALHDFRTARALLRNWIWIHPMGLSTRALMRIQKEVVTVYVASGDLADGETALELYRDDDPSDQGPIALREARMLIQTRHIRAAIWMLASNRTPAARLLTLKARLLGGLASPRIVAQAAAGLGADRELAPARRLQADQIAWQAFENRNHWHEALGMLERILALASEPATHLAPPRAFADELWQTLLSEGAALANRAGLVRGLGKPWITLATGLSTRHPWAALSLLAVVAHGSFSRIDRGAAASRMAHLLVHLPNGHDLLLFLFLDARAIPHPSRLPQTVREHLLTPVLASGHDRLAARLIRGWRTPPHGMAPVRWELTRLEINLYGGQIPRARRELRTDLDHCAPCPHGMRWLGAAFDLERLHLYRPALALLRTLAHEAKKARRRRELLYWIGEDESRLGHWRRAAEDYLWSAAMQNPFAMDPWAQSARFKAARALIHAGLYADALRQYEGLFNASSSPAKKALIAEKIRHLKLHLAQVAHAVNRHA